MSERNLQHSSANRTSRENVASSLNAGLAGVRFPGEDEGRSLGEMAQHDLDAALQLLADRAQYITGSSGAAIALRRLGMNDMMCRASSGANAPELGALLSTEFGLSGESVRTRQLLRCDDAERDARVNRDVCRELGIASVAVMPVVNDEEVLGVFELFSGKPHAFGDRDFAALKRLSEMVETAVKLAQAAAGIPQQLKAQAPAAKTAGEPVRVAEKQAAVPLTANPKMPESPARISESTKAQPPVTAEQTEPAPSPGPKIDPPEIASPGKPSSGRSLMWSVALEGSPEPSSEEGDQSHLPAAFRNLRKCEACGFPISAGRLLCVECEEKKWRGQLRTPAKSGRTEPTDRETRPQPSDRGRQTLARGPQTSSPEKPASSVESRGPRSESRFSTTGAAAAPALAPEARKPQEPEVRPLTQGAPGKTFVPRNSAPSLQPSAVADVQERARAAASMEVVEAIREMLPKVESAEPAMGELPSSSPELVLSAGLEPASWLARNKFVLIAMAVIAGGAVAFLLLH